MAKKKKGGKGYLNAGLGWLINLILAIFPVTSVLLGMITRFMRGHWVAGLLMLTGIGTAIFWVVDLITMITKGDITLWA